MSISVQTVQDRCLALLDAEGTDHYKFDKDFIHAINNAQVWLVNLYNRLFGEKRVSEESLTELIVVRVFKASKYSRLSFSKNVAVISATLAAAAAVDNGDGTVKIPATAHGFARLFFVTISGTTNYDGVFQIITIDDADHFSIYATYVAETFSITDTAVQEDKPWSVLAIYPSITTIPTTPNPAGLPPDDQAESTMISHVSMAKPLKSAKRLTLEEWAAISDNPLLSGSPLITNAELITYGYINMAGYSIDAYGAGNENIEIQISPDVANDLVAAAYLIQPRDITVVGNYLPFPKSLEELVVMKTLNYIAIKEDDRYDIYNISSEEIEKAVQLLS